MWTICRPVIFHFLEGDVFMFSFLLGENKLFYYLDLQFPCFLTMKKYPYSIMLRITFYFRADMQGCMLKILQNIMQTKNITPEKKY